jgi:hypothetical protein
VTTSAPRTGSDIAAALRAVHAESVAYWDSFPSDRFLAPIGEAWSPADNVRHLTKSIRAVNVGLRLPRWVLWIAFRSPMAPSRDYDAMRETYLARLAQGADAGRFAPARRPATPDPERERQRIMNIHRVVIEELVTHTLRWPDRALDRRRLPHPLLGPLTVREMLFFTLYHNRHHVDVVRRRLAAGDGSRNP